jgi:nucleoside-diphosphate-sugar epimerase
MPTPNPSTVLILGSRGRLGAALVQAFSKREWIVFQQTRARRTGDGERVIGADARYAKVILQALRNESGSKRIDVVINACNPIYTRWATESLPINAAAIEVARALNATLLVPGNVYNFGADMTERLVNDTPQSAERVRVVFESRWKSSLQTLR